MEEKKIGLTTKGEKVVICPVCYGSGEVESADKSKFRFSKCQKCKGKGYDKLS